MKKTFFKRLFDKLDKDLEKRSKNCCCNDATCDDKDCDDKGCD